MKSETLVFDAYSRYYNLLYNDKDYVGEVKYIQKLLIENGLVTGNLLEFGSGTGKHGNLLASLGYKIHGIELSAEMVAQAIQGNGFTCQQHDIRNIQLSRSFDAVISLFHVLSYQTSNTSVEAVFARASEHLKAGGLFIFDFWYSPAVYTQKPQVRIKRMSDGSVNITRIAEPIIYSDENRVDVNYTIYATDIKSGDITALNEIHPMRHFSLPEIDGLAKSHGFNRILSEEFQTRRPVNVDTWGVCVVLKKS